MHNPVHLIKPYLLFETSTHPLKFSFNTSFTAPAEHPAPCVLSIWLYSPHWTVGISRTEPAIDIYTSRMCHLYPEAFYIFHSVLVGEIITVGRFNYKVSSVGTWAPAVCMKGSPCKNPTVWRGIRHIGKQTPRRVITGVCTISALGQNWRVRCPGYKLESGLRRKKPLSNSVRAKVLRWFTISPCIRKA